MIAFLHRIDYTCSYENAPIRHYSILCRAVGFLCQQFFYAKKI